MDRPQTLYKITSSSPRTEASADAAAALASAYIVFIDDANYSSTLLKKSKSLFEFANKYRGSYQPSCPFYCSYHGYQDELIWAATWLFKATKDTQYLQFVTNNQGWSGAVNELSWDNKIAGAQALLAKMGFCLLAILQTYGMLPVLLWFYFTTQRLYNLPESRESTAAQAASLLAKSEHLHHHRKNTDQYCFNTNIISTSRQDFLIILDSFRPITTGEESLTLFIHGELRQVAPKSDTPPRCINFIHRYSSKKSQLQGGLLEPALHKQYKTQHSCWSDLVRSRFQ